ncbi:MAG: hypothetical protein ACI4S3_08910 [Candidatus Gastranaerophilaceae bacterium]
MLLSDKYPFLINYFETGIKNKLNNNGVPIAHSLLFYGQDLKSQYIIAKEIARLLNCSGDKSDTCQCLNCKWIRENKHPAVLTISRKDNKPSDDDTKNVISIKQAEMIKNSLMTTSEFFRVFIFCDKDEDGNIRGLNPLNFQDETANSMLKIIEEPNDRIIFIFLTLNKEDIIPTIISRSQCFNISSEIKEEFVFDNIQDIFSNYWQYERKNVFDIAQRLFEMTKTISPKQLLEEIQHYMLYILKSNPNNISFINDIKLVENAKKQIGLGMYVQNVLEDLCLKLIK